MCKTLELKSENYIKLAIFDTAGQERFRSIGPHYYRCAHGAMIVFDVTNPVSFDSVRYWADAIRKHSQAAAKIPLILVGNKSDLLEKRMIMPSEAAQVSICSFIVGFFHTMVPTITVPTIYSSALEVAAGQYRSICRTFRSRGLVNFGRKMRKRNFFVLELQYFRQIDLLIKNSLMKIIFYKIEVPKGIFSIPI